MGALRFPYSQSRDTIVVAREACSISVLALLRSTATRNSVLGRRGRLGLGHVVVDQTADHGVRRQRHLQSTKNFHLTFGIQPWW